MQISKCIICGEEKETIKNICLDCLNKYPKSFDLSDKEPYRIYIKECEKHGIYFGSGPKQKCPICYSKIILCKICGKKIYGIHIDDENDHFCSGLCQRKYLHIKNSGPGVCIECKKFVQNRAVNQRCPKCQAKKSKIIITKNKKSGNCSICEAYNKSRDQNGRGRDVGYGKGEWMNENGQKCGCSCSFNWYNEHNSSDAMIEQSIKLGKSFGAFNLRYSKNHYILKYCNKCQKETPHQINKNKESYCLVCSNNYIWCDHCNQWETVHHNLEPFHWKHYKSNIREWFKNKENQNKLNILKSKIINFQNIEKDTISGIYCWYINSNPFYIGQSIDISTRAFEHMIKMIEFPEYWDLKDENSIIELKILEQCKKEEMNEKELYWINKIRPLSQKCNGTDHIKSLYERNIK